MSGLATIVACHDRTISGANRPLEVKFAQISQTGAGTQTVVAAVAGKKIRVLSVDFVNTVSTTISFQTNATTLFQVGIPNNTPIALKANGYWICETIAGDPFKMQTGSGNLHGRCTYCEVP